MEVDAVDRMALEEQTLSLGAWLLEQDLWPDEKMRLHGMFEHFQGSWGPRSHGRGSTLVVRAIVKDRRDRRRTVAVVDNMADVRRSRLRHIMKSTSRGSRNRPTMDQLIRYARGVVLLLEGLRAAKKLDADAESALTAFKEDVDAASVYRVLAQR